MIVHPLTRFLIRNGQVYDRFDKRSWELTEVVEYLNKVDIALASCAHLLNKDD